MSEQDVLEDRLDRVHVTGLDALGSASESEDSDDLDLDDDEFGDAGSDDFVGSEDEQPAKKN